MIGNSPLSAADRWAIVPMNGGSTIRASSQAPHAPGRRSRLGEKSAVRVDRAETGHRPSWRRQPARGVDHHFRQDGLTPRTVGHDDAARFALGIVYHIGGVAAVKETDARTNQGIVQIFLMCMGRGQGDESPCRLRMGPKNE